MMSSPIAGVGTDRFEQVERPPAVPAPQPVGQALGVGLRAQPVELHQLGLTVELGAGGLGRFAVPVAQVALERDAELLDLLRDLLAHVEAVGELAAEDGDHREVVVTSISCLRLSEVQSVVVWSPPVRFTTSGRTPERSAMMSADVSGGEVEPGVDLLEQERAVVGVDLR
jgi:hypothetical protein